jgi:shikimate dehydrogenase
VFLCCAVIGTPITHSLSPLIHQAFAEQTNLALSYEKIQGDARLFEQQVLDFFAIGGKGLNVTMPYKLRAFEMAEIASQRCLMAGAANTLWIKDSKIHADNTDGIGLVRDLTRYVTLLNARVLILGAGGAARGIIHPLLAERPQSIAVANRSFGPLEKLQEDIPHVNCIAWKHLTGQFDVLINATSAGTSGDNISLPAELFFHHPFCYDLGYNGNGLTPFVAYTKQKGCLAVDGLGMLVEQAAESFYIWHGVRPDTAPVLSERTKLRGS